MKTEVLEVNNQKYLLRIHYESRTNSHTSIGKKQINIRIPLSLNREEQLKELTKMKLWVIKKLQENPQRFKKQQREYKNGEILKVGNEEYIIDIDLNANKSSSAKIVNNNIKLSLSAHLSKEIQNEHASYLISKCIASMKLPEIKERVELLNKKHFNKKINNITLRNTNSRWGSCSLDGDINISTKILLASDDIIDYIIIHELAHLVEPNHSENFWILVKEIIPNYEEKRTWLKENSNKLLL